MGTLPYGIVFWRQLCLVSRGVSLLLLEQQSDGRWRGVLSWSPEPLRGRFRRGDGLAWRDLHSWLDLLSVTAKFKVFRVLILEPYLNSSFGDLEASNLSVQLHPLCEFKR